MITLYHHPRSRSTRFIFLLEELEAPYRIEVVTTRHRDGTGAPDSSNPHPHGKVPAISDDGEVVFESSAIALYLADKYPQKEFGPRVGAPGRGAFLSWLAYYCGVIEPAFVSKALNMEVPRGTAGWVPAEEALAAVSDRLSSGPYLLGERFSAADVLYGTAFAMFIGSPVMARSELIEAYASRVTARPAFARAQSKDGG